MASRITSALARLFGFDAATPTLPADLDTDKMIQALSMLCGPSLGGRRVVKVGGPGQLVISSGEALAGAVLGWGVLSVVGAWTLVTILAPGPIPLVARTHLYAPALTAFAPCTPAGLPLAGWYVVGAGPPGIFVDMNWPWWCVQPLPLGFGVAGVCYVSEYQIAE